MGVYSRRQSNVGSGAWINARVADVVAITALEEEHTAVVAALGCRSGQDHLGREVVTAEVAGIRVAVESLHGMGNVGAAVAIGALLASWHADYLILVGIAGGFERAGVRPGDVVIPDQVVGYETGLVTPDGIHRRPEVYRPDFTLLTAARAVEPREWTRAIRTRPPTSSNQPRAHFGTVLSGEKVIAHADAAENLGRQWPNAVGVEMESYGTALATYRIGGRFLMVKGVSDLADVAKDNQWRAYAAEAAAKFTRAVLGHIPNPSRTGVSTDLSIPGPAMLSICWALVDDWDKLAYYFEIPRHDRVAFPLGHEPMHIWEWLAVRRRLRDLPSCLAFIGRQDLADYMLRVAAKPSTADDRH